MTPRLATVMGWMAIAAVTGLMFLLDHLRMLHSHFNLFIAIVMALSAAVLFAVARLFMAAETSVRPDAQQRPADREVGE